ncbi:hypothetical protein N7447_006816 [Penicillium robsamsonii]|uniref:uncharacterized protein n=1 Tax=Penicillium robsamsonii TaxID=1792511 RepID=UPI0025481A9F|nr:uncharacterized protein N7447_006816 [Penicillium robsamsonii]KAJ5824476.1 hypothetical protein N7447_006816 [Penicillium robsamsonii]
MEGLNIPQCPKHPITHAALAVDSVTDNNSQGAFAFPKHQLKTKLCWNLMLKSIGDVQSFQPLLQRTYHSKGYFIHLAPREMVVGADQQPWALGTLLFPVHWTV